MTPLVLLPYTLALLASSTAAGRLGKEAIGKRGLVYYIDSAYHSDGIRGWVTLNMGVDPDKLQQYDLMISNVTSAIEDQNTQVAAGQLGAVPEQLYTDAEVHAFQAQQIVLPQVLEATSLLFEVGGASATSNQRRLDRHWRNARTLASHNPAIYREQALGNYYLNGISPAAAWRAKQSAASDVQPTFDEASAV